jgi:BirA family biotin operon repressor/biotin-[acetyl-CoA-carboxylase] ligase
VTDSAQRTLELDGFRVLRLETCASTMIEARHLAGLGGVYQTVWADEQTAGRGRRGRSWLSPAGAGLYFTTILPVVAPRERLGLGSLAVGVAVAEAVQAELGVQTGLKWPNDLLAPDGRKLAGILLESDAASGTVLAGVGVNVQVMNHTHPSVVLEGAALEEFGLVNRERLLGRMLKGIRSWWSSLEADPERVLDAWRARSVTLGCVIMVHQASGVSFEALATDLDATGALIVLRDGASVTISSGEVTVRHVAKAGLEQKTPS